jgi:hypothetical protein
MRSLNLDGTSRCRATSAVGRWRRHPTGVGCLSPRPPSPTVPAAPVHRADPAGALVGEEVRRLLESAHREVVELITRHRNALESLSAALRANETLDEQHAYAAAGVLRSAASPERASLDSVWSPGEQRAAARLPDDDGRSALRTTLPTRTGAP